MYGSYLVFCRYHFSLQVSFLNVNFLLMKLNLKLVIHEAATFSCDQIVKSSQGVPLLNGLKVVFENLNCGTSLKSEMQRHQQVTCFLTGKPDTWLQIFSTTVQSVWHFLALIAVSQLSIPTVLERNVNLFDKACMKVTKPQVFMFVVQQNFQPVNMIQDLCLRHLRSLSDQ